MQSDREELQERYEELAPTLLAWAHLRISPSMRCHVDAEDVIQEVWLRAVARYDSYDHRRSFRSWVFGIAKRVLLEGFRAGRRRRFVEPGRGPSTRLRILEGCADHATRISQRLARSETVQRFVRMADALSPEDRKTLVYCGLEQLTCAEAATRIGVSEEATIKRWQRLRARMRESAWVRCALI